MSRSYAPDQPLIISHRGDRLQANENTILACELAVQQGANALEIDIRETGSGDVVLLHDNSLQRIFNKPGYVGQTALSELRTFPFVPHATQRTSYIDTLDDLFDRFKNTVPINLDAKTIHFFDFKFADKIIATIRNHNLWDTVWISCFNPFLLQILKLKNRRIRTGYLFQRTTWMHTMYDLVTFADAWHPHYRVLTEDLITKSIKHGKELYIWTVNEVDIIQEVLRYPVHGIITDRPLLLRTQLGKNGTLPPI
jgi:glycerophosphoryl diester phosphodiesterase